MYALCLKPKKAQSLSDKYRISGEMQKGGEERRGEKQDLLGVGASPPPKWADEIDIVVVVLTEGFTGAWGGCRNK